MYTKQSKDWVCKNCSGNRQTAAARCVATYRQTVTAGGHGMAQNMTGPDAPSRTVHMTTRPGLLQFAFALNLGVQGLEFRV